MEITIDVTTRNRAIILNLARGMDYDLKIEYSRFSFRS